MVCCRPVVRCTHHHSSAYTVVLSLPEEAEWFVIDLVILLSDVHSGPVCMRLL